MNVVGGGGEPGAVLDLGDIERRNPGQLGRYGYMYPDRERGFPTRMLAPAGDQLLTGYGGDGFADEI
jgi:hypothetical protein